MTWVLIVFSYHAYATSFAVPGYKTEAECEAAKLVITEGFQKNIRNPVQLKMVCVRGPTN